MNFVGLMKIEVEALYLTPPHQKAQGAYQNARLYLAEKQQIFVQILSEAIQSATPTL